MEFHVLGSIEVFDGYTPIDVGPARQRGVLAALLVGAGRVVTTADLVERVWGPARPRQVRASLYSYLSRLRGALAGGPVLSRRAGGYLLAADPMSVDLHRFRHLCSRARSDDDDETAAARFGEALGGWRGTAFAELDTPYFNLQREAADRERLAAELDHSDVRLRLGQHGELLAELFSRAGAHPLDERASGQLMLALFRCGRAADALAHYRLTRQRLREQVGGEPGAALRQLHKTILDGDLGPVVTGSARRIPRQLPAPPAVFVGRAWELAELDRLADAGTAMALATIGGTGGIGKTTMALHWAHRNSGRFPDGQLYADLRGFDPAGEPVPASVALRGFLEALGTASTAIPADQAGRSALYRSLVSDRRMLVLLDNARDTAQVEPLLPGSSACMVVVTGRRQLAGLVAAAGARPITLDALPSAEGQELLAHHLGRGRLVREAKAAAALVAHCAGLPLATSIVAARARIQSGLPLAALAAELDDRSARLDALDAGDLNADLRTVFAASYRALDPPLARAFGLLGGVPGPDIGLPAAAALLGRPAEETRTMLRRLTTAYLLREPVPGRYQMHDLVQLYAAERGAHDQPEDTVRRARHRMTAYYVDVALAADRMLAPHRSVIETEPARHDGPTDAAGAMSWFTTEHESLTAVQRAAAVDGRPDDVWRIAWALDTFHWRRGLLAERIAMLGSALPATEERGDPGDAALNHRLLGRAYVPLGRHDRALHHLGTAAAGYETAGDADGQAQTQLNLALAWERHGDDGRALAHAEANLSLRAALGHPAREAEALNAVGWYHARVGNHDAAERYCRQALALCREHGLRETEAYTRDSLGYTAHQGGRLTDALAHYGDALELRRALGDSYEEADTLARLGEVLHALGRPARADEAWRAASALYQAQGRSREAAALRSQSPEVVP